MPIISCEKCGKEFVNKSRYAQHQNGELRVSDTKIENVAINKEHEHEQEQDKPDKDTEPKKITIDSSSFDEIKKYYDETLNTDKSTYKSSNDEPTPID
jgi:uncharacterized C2H2 Zn-finger protein